ncbi:MAG TPA: glycosyltransferase [Opitutaceae bacterium]|nr:glycosyltransferase [Opitutaceae bacterium]
MTPSGTHLVIIPAYNPGVRFAATVADALEQWRPVLVVIDGSTDGSAAPLLERARQDPDLRVLVLPRNRGKGAAVLAGAQAAVAQGFTHALLLDADGQHPAASIREFMAASAARPEAMILGRPVFGPDAPTERRLGRKISVALVHGETLGRSIADPLCGFRVLPLRPLLAALGRRRGGRRYDFDTESVVRLHWAGVPAVNLPAPVRYFPRAAGGVSHFRYGRDNLRLAWMHTRLITELLVRVLTGRRRPRAPAAAAVVLGALLLGATLPAPRARAAGADEAPVPLRLDPPDPAWRDLLGAVGRRTTVEAPFEERRWFPFRRKPVELTGEVRIDAARGLSLHYQTPQESTVIIDAQGLLIRQDGRDTVPPPDPRARAADSALLHLLRFDFAALAGSFALSGRRSGPDWTLVLTPRDPGIRRTLGEIVVHGAGDLVQRIQLRRSATEHVEITIGPPRPEAPFGAEALRRYFR